MKYKHTQAVYRTGAICGKRTHTDDIRVPVFYYVKKEASGQITYLTLRNGEYGFTDLSDATDFPEEVAISVRESLSSRYVFSVHRMMVVSVYHNEDLSIRSDVMAPDITDPILSALKYAVKLFWLKKYNKNPVWATGNVEEWDLCQALTAANFSQQFSKMTLSNMHTIHQICNGVRSDNDSITVGDAKELLFLLAKCVKAIEDTIPMQIITASSEAPPLSDIEIIRNGEYRFTFLSNANDFPEITAIKFANELRGVINLVHDFRKHGIKTFSCSKKPF